MQEKLNFNFEDKRLISVLYYKLMSLGDQKVLHRVQFSKARLADIYPGRDAGCDRGFVSPAGLAHAFCSFPCNVL